MMQVCHLYVSPGTQTSLAITAARGEHPIVAVEQIEWSPDLHPRRSLL